MVDTKFDPQTKSEHSDRSGEKSAFQTARPAVASLEKIVIEVSPDGPPDAKKERKCKLTQKSNGPNGRLVGQDIKLDKDFGPFVIAFELDKDLDWDTADPFWIKQNSCPQTSEVDKKQIWAGDAKGKTVTIMDMNVDPPCTLKYRMNFKDGTYCDPVVENGGGNKP